MKDNSLDGHRGKVALSDTTRNAATSSSSSNSSSVVVKCDLKSPSTASTTTANDGSAATNFDDDYNEWDVGIGDLIIDLDADIEKTNERNGNSTQQGIQHHSQQNGTTAPSPSSAVNDSPTSAATFSFLGSPCNNNNLAAAMSNSKSPRLSGNSGVSAGATSSGTGVTTSGSNNNGASVPGSSTFEHQATVDKGLKMKIKRKTVGSKYSEAKHEIVQSDTKSGASSHNLPDNSNVSNNSNNCASSASTNSPANSSEAPKSKHSSSKGRNSSHREKKEKNRDKDKNSSARNNPPSSSSSEMNGVIGVMSPIKITSSGVSLSSPAPPALCSNSSPLPCSTVNASVSSITSVANSPASSNCGQETVQTSCGPLMNMPLQAVASNSPPMPNLTLKLETKFTPSPVSQPCTGVSVAIKQEDGPTSPPPKKIKMDIPERNGELDCPGSPTPEMKDASTCISVGTITEPDCLGPCEPGTSVMLEGIVWQETEGGVLVVNVTWRGKTYVGTLLDCTKHDWAPPRFCESPTSDVDSKASKGRGKRGRGGNNSSSDLNFADTRNCVQSKLRNGKGRRTTINSNASSSGFTVPNSPAKSDNGSGNGKRKGRPADLDITPTSDGKSSKRNRTQNRSTTSSTSTEFSQPSSPVLIVCPEPNCSKKYKHINGLRYHQTHAHSASDSSKIDDTTTEDSKDVTNSSDNEESMQESASVSTSPAPTFANTVPSHSAGGKLLLNETTSSSSSNLNSLPESDPFNITTDLSTLASVAINDSKTSQKVVNSSRTISGALHSAVPQDLPIVSSEGDSVPGLSVSNSPPISAPVSSPVLPVTCVSPSASGTSLTAAVSAVTTSVIQSSNSVDSTPISQAVTVSIPTSHVIFNQGISGTNSTNVCYTTSAIVCNNSNSLSPSRNIASANVTTTTFAQVSSIVSTAATSPSPILPIIDKSKVKTERPDKYKPKSPLSTSAIRPIVPAPTPLIALSPSMPPHPAMDINSHSVVSSSLKPIQPKPTVLGEPTTVNPALDSLKKEKSKHKKKSKDKDKEREKKLPSLPLTPTKLGMNPNEECEAMELTSYPSLEAVPGSAATMPGAPHSTLAPLVSQPKPPETSLDMSLADDSIENIQSPAYSDISDANDTAPVLESEVPSVKEKEDKVGKSTPDASQSPAANINAYGMYPYYSQPPYLLPSVSPQSAVSGAQGPNINEKNDSVKKVEQERVKENRPWSNPSGEARERPHMEHHESEKKPVREETVQNPGSVSSPAAAPGPVQDYAFPQHYPYSYGYGIQGYPYSVEPSYHMHMLENDPHYKQQYKQFIENQERMYKETQHHHQQQQLQQHMQQQQQPPLPPQQHHQQSQQQPPQQPQQQQPQQQQSSHHGHQSHHSQHSSHHQSKSQHHSIKEERDRSREVKERSAPMEKMPNSGLIVEHSNKIQHSSMAIVSNKEHDVREIETRPPSLPAQTRIDSSSASAAALKEKQNENHQILKENIELKSQMDDSKNKINQYEMAMLYERHREDMRRYYMYQDRVIEQQQQKMEPGIHHHTHLHQTVQSHSHIQTSSASYSSSSSLKPHKDDLSSSISSHSKSNHYGDSTRSSVVSPAKSEHIKTPHTNTSSPKGSIRDSSLSSSKDYMSSAVSSRDSSASKKESQSKSSERSESSTREEKKSEKTKVEPKVESEGQKPTMETTGPPPPPTNSYAYLHPSYLQGPPHFPHMPFEPAHAMYRGGINPMIVSTPHYGSSPYVHPQIRYVGPGACELPAHSQPPEALANKMHPSGPPKALDLLHQVSQHYTTTHKIHELQEHALMSPTPTSTPSSTPSTVSSSASGKSSTEPVVVAAKMEGPRDTSRSPPTQRHIHQHHHTHVGVGYPIYDPYGAIIPSPAPAVDCKPIHPLQVKPPAAGARFWP